MTLHYIHDPLCGWCYGAAPLVQAARAVVSVRPHGGGMMSGSRLQPVTPELRDYVMPHDRRIAGLTGQPFGEAYFNGLLRDGSAVFDSTPPIAAMLAADAMAGRGLDLLSRLQTAHYVEGRRIAERDVLVGMATGIGLAPAVFARQLDAAAGEPVRAHLAETRRLMAQVGAQGFPTFVLERDGIMTVVELGEFIGRPEKLVAWLKDRGAAPAEAQAATKPGCGPGGCSLPTA
jgi:putative protein-disulfide isomerase